MTTPLGKSITRNQMKGMEQPDQILLPTTEIGGSRSIDNTLRTHTANHKYPTSQPDFVQLKKKTGPGHNYWNHVFIVSLNSGIDFPIYGRNIDNNTGINPQGPIVTTIPKSNRESN